MGGFQKFETPELHERDLAARKLELEHSAVVRRAEQDRLRLECDARLPVPQHPLDDVPGLGAFVLHRREKRASALFSFRPEILRKPLGRERKHRVGGGENGLRRAVVLCKRYRVRGRAEQRWKIKDVSHGGGTE